MDEKKDLTFITDVGSAEATPPIPEAFQDSVSAPLESPSEKIETFEDLASYAASETDGSELPAQTAESDSPPATLDAFAEQTSVLEETSPLQSDLPEVQETHTPPPSVSPSVSEPTHSLDPIQPIREYAERVAIGKPAVPAAYPFTIRITGPLTSAEQTRLKDLITKENMGVAVVDLEIQFRSQQVLIPRVSEFAGVLIVQALRDSQAQIRLAPSDSSEDIPLSVAPENEKAEHFSSFEEAPNALLPVFPGDPPIEMESWTLLATLTASATLQSVSVEASRSPEYEELMERLQTEIRKKAHLRGAHAVVRFMIQLIPLSPTRYKVLAIGTALKKPF